MKKTSEVIQEVVTLLEQAEKKATDLLKATEYPNIHINVTMHIRRAINQLAANSNSISTSNNVGSVDYSQPIQATWVTNTTFTKGDTTVTASDIEQLNQVIENLEARIRAGASLDELKLEFKKEKTAVKGLAKKLGIENYASIELDESSFAKFVELIGVKKSKTDKKK